MTYVSRARVYEYLVILARIRLDIGVIQRTTSSSTGSRAWTDLNLEQRHDRFDRTVPLRGNFICRPSRPWASSASTSGRFENSRFSSLGEMYNRCWRRVYYCRWSARNSSPPPPSSFSLHLFQLPLSSIPHLLWFLDRLMIYIYSKAVSCRFALLRFFLLLPLLHSLLCELFISAINPWCYTIVIHS